MLLLLDEFIDIINRFAASVLFAATVRGFMRWFHQGAFLVKIGPYIDRGSPDAEGLLGFFAAIVPISLLTWSCRLQ